MAGAYASNHRVRPKELSRRRAIEMSRRDEKGVSLFFETTSSSDTGLHHGSIGGTRSGGGPADWSSPVPESDPGTWQGEVQWKTSEQEPGQDPRLERDHNGSDVFSSPSSYAGSDGESWGDGGQSYSGSAIHKSPHSAPGRRKSGGPADWSSPIPGTSRREVRWKTPEPELERDHTGSDVFSPPSSCAGSDDGGGQSYLGDGTGVRDNDALHSSSSNKGSMMEPSAKEASVARKVRPRRRQRFGSWCQTRPKDID
jgi:hypothetical protein